MDSRFNISNTYETIEIKDLNINQNEFLKLIKVIKLVMPKIGIDPSNMQILYQRNQDATSMLAIKVTEGLDDDINNYMINGCKTWYQNDTTYCDIYMHADKRSAQQSNRLANLINEEIISFFEETEKHFLKNNCIDIELSIRIPLTKEKSTIKSKIKNIFKKN